MQKIDFENTEIAFEDKSNKELRQTYQLFKMMNSKVLVSLGSSLTLLALKLKLPIKGIIKKTIFKHFCGGATFSECQLSIDALAKYKVASILDYGAEGKEGEEAFQITIRESLRAIEFAAKNDTVPVVSCKVSGLSENWVLEAITNQDKPSVEAFVKFDACIERLDVICKKANELRVALFIDAEESWYQVAIDRATDLMMERYNKDYVTVYNTYQLYRHDRLAFLKESHSAALEKGFILGAKLVRGAYMEKERQRAAEMNYPSPIHKDKASCDVDYNLAVEYCVNHHETIASCVASHNEYSTQYQIDLMHQMKIDKRHKHFNFCQLYGMSDNLTFNLAKAGYTVAKYVPYGPIDDVIPYLIRRARENSSVDGEVSRELRLIKQELKRRKT